jgi:hypothetical protein
MKLNQKPLENFLNKYKSTEIDYDNLFNEIFNILYNNNSYIKLSPFITDDKSIMDYDTFSKYNFSRYFRVTDDEISHTKKLWKLMCKVELAVAENYYFQGYFRTNIEGPNSQFSKEDENFIIKYHGSVTSFFKKILCEIHNTPYCLLCDMIKKCREINDTITFKKLDFF